MYRNGVGQLTCLIASENDGRLEAVTNFQTLQISLQGFQATMTEDPVPSSNIVIKVGLEGGSVILKRDRGGMVIIRS